jgi:hypothetical protein
MAFGAYRLRVPRVRSLIHSGAHSMLAVPHMRASAAKSGQRGSPAMSSIQIRPCSRAASIQGPSPVSCCLRSRSRGAWPVTAWGTSFPPTRRISPASGARGFPAGSSSGPLNLARSIRSAPGSACGPRREREALPMFRHTSRLQFESKPDKPDPTTSSSPRRAPSRQPGWRSPLDRGPGATGGQPCSVRPSAEEAIGGRPGHRAQVPARPRSSSSRPATGTAGQAAGAQRSHNPGLRAASAPEAAAARPARREPSA